MIREATVDDISALLEMAPRFHAASPWAHIPLNIEKLRTSLLNLITSDGATLLVNDDLSGAIGLVSGQIYFADAVVVQETFWWCEKPGAGLALLDAAEKWARDTGASHMSMIRLEGLGDDRVDKIYRQRGYVSTEHTYLKGL